MARLGHRVAGLVEGNSVDDDHPERRTARTSTPSQKPAVAISRPCPEAVKRASRSRRGASPCTRGSSPAARRRVARRSSARRLVVSTKTPPPLPFTSGSTASATASV